MASDLEGCKRRPRWLQEGSKRPPRGEVSERSGALSEGPRPQSPDRYVSGGGRRGEGGGRAPPEGCKRRPRWLQEGSKRPPWGEVSERSGALSEGPGPQSHIYIYIYMDE